MNPTRSQNTVTNTSLVRTACRKWFGTLIIAAMALLASAAEATAGWEYYRDVYGDGRWSWSRHNYPSQQRAMQEAGVSCRIGTRVTFIGYFDARGRMLVRIPYRCR